MTIDLSPEELALCIQALREQAQAREDAVARELHRFRECDPVYATAETRGKWMQEAHTASLLAAKIEDTIAHQDAPTYGPAVDLCPHCRQPLHVHSCVDFACPV